MPLVIGVPKEIKDNENRVAVLPDGAAELVHHGHQVLVEAGAGAGSRFPDEEYAAAGATVVADADEVFAGADLIVKVKEPIPAEYHRFREGQQLFTYLHLAADKRADRVPAGAPDRLDRVRDGADAPTASCRCSRR